MSQPSGDKTIRLDLQVGTQDLGAHWMAFEPRLGIVVFADTEEAAEERFTTALDVLLDTIASSRKEGMQDVLEYLDNHDVKYSYAVPSNWAFNIEKQPSLVFANVR